MEAFSEYHLLSKKKVVKVSPRGQFFGILPGNEKFATTQPHHAFRISS